MTAAAAQCTALVEASLNNFGGHDFVFYGKRARVAERTVDTTLSEDLRACCGAEG